MSSVRGPRLATGREAANLRPMAVSARDWPLGRGVEVLAEGPGGLVALAKPPGARSQPNGSERDDGAVLTSAFDPQAQAFVLPRGGRAWLLHRLDAPTSGVLLLAGEEATAAAARAVFAAGRVRKRYEAVVWGALRSVPPLWRDALRERREHGALRVEVAPGGLPAFTRARFLRGGAGLAVAHLELRPQTGRTHQLRVQCASRRWPIVGDATYGDFEANRALRAAGLEDRLYLHAAGVELTLGRVAFGADCPAPPAFAALLAAR